jgi:DNA modification methylase
MAQASLNLDPSVNNVEAFEFEPIKGYPMLQWKGKRPFRSTHYYPAQQKEAHGEEVNGWLNQIFWGDNLQVMSHLLKKYRGQVDLVYIDPPFDSKIDYKKRITLRGQAVSSDALTFEEKQYSDIWANDEYLQFIYERLILIKELLAKDGCVYLHCDWHKGHYLRLIMDEVFGKDGFKNEIVWHYYNKMQGNVNHFSRNHDSIYLYAKSEDYYFDKVREKREETVKQIKRVWSPATKSLVNAKDEFGKVMYIEATHRTIDDVWRMSMLQPADKTENLRYPTQKPEKLIERILLASSKPGDLVFDCFMGSGTTQAVAMRLGRRFIGADINLGAVQTTTKRLIHLATDLKEEGGQFSIEYEDGEEKFPLYTGFAVSNVNHYDVFRNPVQAKDLLLEALEIQPMPNGSVYDGEQDGYMVKIMPVNRIATKADLRELVMNIDQREWMRRRDELGPNKAVEHIRLICMGHDADLGAELQRELSEFKLKVEVVDILRDRGDLEFKRDSQADIQVKGNKLVIRRFYPMNLLQKLSLQKEKVGDWRELVESVMIDFNYDGAVLQPQEVDIPEGQDLVIGEYAIPKDAGTIRVKITDLLSESLEMTLPNNG